MFDQKSRVPLYVQLADILREQIRTGEIKEGDKLPSESEMIKQYHLGRLTIRDSLAILVNEGLLEKQHGKGTFCKAQYVPSNHRVDVLLNLSDIYFIPNYLRTICDVLGDENVNIVLSDTHDNADTICTLLEKALSEGSDGVLFQPTTKDRLAPEKLLNLLNKLIVAGIPYIMIDTFYENAPASYIVMDEIRAGSMAAEYFNMLGHKSICMISRDEYTDSTLRMQGFEEAFPNTIYRINYDDDKFCEDVQNILKEHTDITGFFCYHDGIAKELYKALRALKLSVPDDISVVSVDDTIIASTLSPSLTSVIHPKEHLGKESAKAILSIISRKTTFPYTKVFQPSLAVRKSCKQL